MDYKSKLIPIAKPTPVQNTGVKSYLSKLVPLQKTVEQQRAERIAQGLPVSVNKDRVAPTLAGGLIRGAIGAAGSTLLSIPAAFAGEKGITVQSDYIGKTSDLAKKMNNQVDVLANKVNTGQISKGRAIAGVLGQAALNTADVASLIPVGGAAESTAVNTVKALAGQGLKQTAKQAAIGAGKSFVRGAVPGALYDVGAQLASGEKYNPMQTVKSAALGGALDVGVSQVAPKVISGVASKGKEIYANKFTQSGREAGNVSRVTKELKQIENNYEKLRKNQKFSKDANAGSRKRVVESGVLNSAVDETGTIKTDNIIEKYKQVSPINNTENVVRQNLARLGETVDPSVIEKELVQAVYASGLEGADLRNALNNVKKEIAGYRLKADNVTGKIPLILVHDAKISTTKGINFNTPPEVATYRKAIASGLKTAVENNSSFNVKEVNDSLAPYLQDIKYLESLNGRKVKGGKLGKYTAQITGNIVGGAAGGAIGGLPGSAVGTIVGGEVAGAIKGRSLAGTLGGVTPKEIPRSPVLEKAVATGKSPRLGLPAPRDEFRSVVGSGPVINLPARTEPIYKSPRIALQPQKTTIPIKNPTKIGIPKVSNKSATKATKLSTDLISEAKKYKSADEFVKAQGTPDLSKLRNEAEILKDKFQKTQSGNDLREWRKKQNEIENLEIDIAKKTEINKAIEQKKIDEKLRKIDTSVDKLSDEDLDFLTNEAKKTGNLDEFIGKVRGSATQYGEYNPKLRKYLRPESIFVGDIKGLNPNTKITVYRGIDAKSVAGKQIKTGDFVTTDFDDALGYTDSPSKVVSKEVRLKDLIEEYPDEIDITNPLKPVSYELIYNPTGKIKKITKSQLTDIWNKANKK